jgi:collagenase-like PrtC family protease
MSELITTLESAGDAEQLLIAGADTILVALQDLSSTVADKLTMEQLDLVIEAAKAAGKKIAVRANMTIHEGSLAVVEEKMKELAERDVDAIWTTDPSVFYLAKRKGMTDKIVYDPEMLMTSINDASWWLERGIKGICISPILTLQETEEIAGTVKKAVVTVHGRTLMSRSYRKLLTAYQQTNAENPDTSWAADSKLEGRKTLALTEKTRDGRMPVFEDETGTLIYSDNVLDSFDFIEDVLKSNPMGLLIEGSFLNQEEQCAAVRAYKRILGGESAAEVGKEYRSAFAFEPLDSGYYEQKTVR